MEHADLLGIREGEIGVDVDVHVEPVGAKVLAADGDNVLGFGRVIPSPMTKKRPPLTLMEMRRLVPLARPMTCAPLVTRSKVAICSRCYVANGPLGCTVQHRGSWGPSACVWCAGYEFAACLLDYTLASIYLW